MVCRPGANPPVGTAKSGSVRPLERSADSARRRLADGLADDRGRILGLWAERVDGDLQVALLVVGRVRERARVDVDLHALEQQLGRAEGRVAGGPKRDELGPRAIGRELGVAGLLRGDGGLVGERTTAGLVVV